MTMLLEKRRELLFGALVAIMAFCVYANSLGNGFALDDDSVILNNPVLRGSPLSLLSAIDTTNEAQLLPFYRPFTYLTFYVEGQLHGFNPFYIRLFNVLLHTANALLVYCFARTLLNDNNAALLAGLLFAIHPLHAEGVNFNAGGRNTMLACFFMLLAYLFHNKSVTRCNLFGSIVGALLFLFGLFSKETALMVLPFIIVQEIVYMRNSSNSRLGIIFRIVPYLIGVTCYLVMRWVALAKFGIQTSLIPGVATQKIQDMYIVPEITERLINNLYIIPKYLLTVVLPISLSSRYEIPGDFHLLSLQLALAWLVIIIVLGWLLTRGRSWTTFSGLLWFMLFWIPVSGIVYVPGASLADRFLYIPAIGLWLVAADQFVRFVTAGSTARKYAVFVLVISFIMLAILTVRRNFDWKNNITLYSSLVEKYPENAYGHAGLGSAYFGESRNSSSYLVLAEQELERALTLSPTPATFPAAHKQLGHIKQNRGDYQGALYHYSEALAIFPNDKEARINRGIVFEKTGRYKEALQEYQFFLSVPGDNNILGSQEYAKDRIRELSGD